MHAINIQNLFWHPCIGCSNAEMLVMSVVVMLVVLKMNDVSVVFQECQRQYFKVTSVVEILVKVTNVIVFDRVIVNHCPFLYCFSLFCPTNCFSIELPML